MFARGKTNYTNRAMLATDIFHVYLLGRFRHSQRPAHQAKLLITPFKTSQKLVIYTLLNGKAFFPLVGMSYFFHSL